MQIGLTTLLAIFLHLLTSDFSLSAPVKSGVSCGLKLEAADFPKVLTSPGYPGYFAGQTQCTWLIAAPEGRRVKLVIKDFALINEPSCISQYVMFTDDFTGHQYGPLCRRRPQEEIISGGNTLRVKLESDTNNMKRYRGFKMSYTSTMEATTDTMKDPAGKWQKLMKPKASVAASPTPTDSIVDLNENAAINLKNQGANERNDQLNDQRSAENFTPTVETPSQPTQKMLKTTTIPGRWFPSKRTKLKRPTIIRTRTPPIKPVYPRYRDEEETESKQDDTAVTALKYVGIVFAVLIILIVGGVIYYKMRQRASQSEKDADSNIISTISSKISPPDTAEFHKICNEKKAVLEAISLDPIECSVKQRSKAKTAPAESQCHVKAAPTANTSEVPPKSEGHRRSSKRHLRSSNQTKKTFNERRERSSNADVKRNVHRLETKKQSVEMPNTDRREKSSRRKKKNERSINRKSGEHRTAEKRRVKRRSSADKLRKFREPTHSVMEEDKRRKKERRRRRKASDG